MRHTFTAAAGTRMHSVSAGPAGAPEIVCVHGLGCSYRYFLPLVRELSAGARVTAVDLPGFGRTRGPARALDVRGLSLALAAWLRETGLGGSVLVGNSGGCQVLVDLAVHSPGLLGPLVLAGPTMDRHARRPLVQAGRLLRSLPRERASLGPLLAFDYLVCGPRRFAATFHHLLADPVEAKAPLVTGPAVVVRGERDPIVPHAWAAELAAALPQGRLEEIRGAGHAVNYSAPRALAAITQSLL